MFALEIMNGNRFVKISSNKQLKMYDEHIFMIS